MEIVKDSDSESTNSDPDKKDENKEYVEFSRDVSGDEGYLGPLIGQDHRTLSEQEADEQKRQEEQNDAVSDLASDETENSHE